MANFLKSFFGRSQIAKELLEFMWKRKLWYLIPIIVILLLVGILIIFAQSSAVAPFIYTLF
ncbi:MAG: DUF5989 family protein [Candidatus Omnitrophota bacterium]